MFRYHTENLASFAGRSSIIRDNPLSLQYNLTNRTHETYLDFIGIHNSEFGILY